MIYFDTKERIKILKNLERQLEQSGEIFLGSSDFVPDIVDLKEEKALSTRAKFLNRSARSKNLQLLRVQRAQSQRPKRYEFLLLTTRLLRENFFVASLREIIRLKWPEKLLTDWKASDFSKSQSVDVMTLDIHMPSKTDWSI